MIFAFIAAGAGQWPVTWVCEAREVSASGYYARASRPDSATQEWRQELVDAIEEIHTEVKGATGARA